MYFIQNTLLQTIAHTTKDTTQVIDPAEFGIEPELIERNEPKRVMPQASTGLEVEIEVETFPFEKRSNKEGKTK